MRKVVPTTPKNFVKALALVALAWLLADIVARIVG